ncbi:hypothetical protein CPB85DRAFT_263959 [Mucidula mucida]|nr:hypothetical protein CPB85DRAFT_263959 [Mucidula mucida]
MQFRISLGHQPEQKVLEVNMFYHVAVILLYRPFYKDKSKVGVFLDAASTFNMLLEKYRNTDTSPSLLSVSSPSMIYLIFTTAIAHLSGYKYKEKTESHSTTAALQTQLHLLHCLEALKAIGGTWELARRCWRTLDRLMEVEGLRPSVPGEVKRKRDGDDNPPPRQREEPTSTTALMFPPSTTEGSFPLGDMNFSPLLLPADYFDPSLNMAWLPDVGSGLWDGEWDEKFWGKSLMGLGLDGVSLSQDI